MPFDLIIFALILAVLFFDAILSMVALAGPFNCLDGQQFLSGSTGAHPSVHSVLGWAGGLILFLLVSQSLAALILRQKFSLTAVTFGVLNLALLVMTMRQVGLTWSYYNPGEPLAQYVQSLNRPIAVEWGVGMTDVDADIREQNNMLMFDRTAWTCIEGAGDSCLFLNEELGFTARRMVFSQCFSTELVRLNWQAFTDEPFPDHHPNTDVGFAYFDPEGRWIRPWKYYHPRTHTIEAALTEAQLQPSSIGWYELSELLWQQYEARPIQAEPLRPYTLEEIETIVARNWGDDRVHWRNDD